jgi:hypothetical protein
VNIKGKKFIFAGTRTQKRLIFVVVASVLVMSSPKQTTEALMPFFCHAKYLGYTNDLQWEKKPRHFYTFGLCSCTLLTEANNLVLGPSPNVLSFRATGTTLTGTHS